MKQPTDEELDFLLARGRMSGATRERILAEVTTRTIRLPRSRRWMVGGGLAATLALAAGVLLGFRPRHDAFTARGSADVSNPVATVDIMCLEGGSATCHLGGTLVFRVEGTAGRVYLGAYAIPEPSSKASEERVWYFPESTGEWPEVSGDRETQVVARGIKLGPEHHVGRYVVHVVLTRRPLTREEMLDPKNPDVSLRSTRVIELVP